MIKRIVIEADSEFNEDGNEIESDEYDDDYSDDTEIYESDELLLDEDGNRYVLVPVEEEEE